jgi:hypothetical protein
VPSSACATFAQALGLELLRGEAAVATDGAVDHRARRLTRRDQVAVVPLPCAEHAAEGVGRGARADELFARALQQHRQGGRGSS